MKNIVVEWNYNSTESVLEDPYNDGAIYLDNEDDYEEAMSLTKEEAIHVINELKSKVEELENIQSKYSEVYNIICRNTNLQSPSPSELTYKIIDNIYFK